MSTSRFARSPAADYRAHIPRTQLERRISRALKDARRHYQDAFDIDFRWFDLAEIATTNECSWQPDDSWKALLLIEKARNEIVHGGTSRCYVLSTLTDAWYPFEFAHAWVEYFDANFDGLMFEGRRYPLIEAYEERRNRAAAERPS